MEGVTQKRVRFVVRVWFKCGPRVARAPRQAAATHVNWPELMRRIRTLNPCGRIGQVPRTRAF
ncbi:hypothetical protein AWV80_12175 [Cupriavidus sp. UYMU48A]|nr:hypothetical protein AWV80_12175 [Cupriavidus sp. UYMU48A]